MSAARPVPPRESRIMPGTKAAIDFGDYGTKRVTVLSGPDTKGRYMCELPAGAGVLASRPSIRV